MQPTRAMTWERNQAMDAALISAFSGLAGAIIGGVTSTTSSVFGERVKDRRSTVEDSWKRREHLYNEFISTASTHLADALTHERDDPGALMQLYSLVASMRLISPSSVVAAAEAVTLNLQRTYEAPNRSLRQIQIFSKDPDGDPLLAFSEAGRDDLRD